ncbi:hypothetical protein LTR36_004428 [Oleoguttula mirabilis]|uniref:Uncharacterized protein n=1 Tax=Oleoguttula mirabilis TaxID=1507867 RepID=A0AAV9JFX2_9PEZI|nr:hypothetical protein LTR36_004428 [Oleoguttula mirabilis]
MHDTTESSRRLISAERGRPQNAPVGLPDGLLPQTTLMGLPDELLTKIVGYAVTSDEAINLYPETFEQNLTQMRQKLSAPFATTPRLLAMAAAEFSASNLVYRTSMRTLHVDKWRKAASYDPDSAAAAEEDLGNDLEALGVKSDHGRRLWFGSQHSPAYIEQSAKEVRHLELLMVLEVAGGKLDQNGNALVRWNTNSMAYLFAQLGKAFPELRSLLVRITTYRTGGQITTFFSSSHSGARIWYAGRRPDLRAQEFRHRIARIIRGVDGLRLLKLKAKAVVLFQQEARDWRKWRDGPLSDPAFNLGQMTDGDRSNVDGFVWRMMDLPSCRVTL